MTFTIILNMKNSDPTLLRKAVKDIHEANVHPMHIDEWKDKLCGFILMGESPERIDRVLRQTSLFDPDGSPSRLAYRCRDRRIAKIVEKRLRRKPRRYTGEV